MPFARVQEGFQAHMSTSAVTLLQVVLVVAVWPQLTGLSPNEIVAVLKLAAQGVVYEDWEVQAP